MLHIQLLPWFRWYRVRQLRKVRLSSEAAQQDDDSDYEHTPASRTLFEWMADIPKVLSYYPHLQELGFPRDEPTVAYSVVPERESQNRQEQALVPLERRGVKFWSGRMPPLYIP